MNQISYSQHGQDLIISNLFKDVGIGIYVDVGAGDPINLSNTYLLDLNG